MKLVKNTGAIWVFSDTDGVSFLLLAISNFDTAVIIAASVSWNWSMIIAVIFYCMREVIVIFFRAKRKKCLAT